MPARKPTVLIAVLVLCVLAGCAGIGTGTTADSPSPTVTPNSTATPTPAATPSPVATPTQEPVSAAQIVAVAKQFWTGDMTCHDAPTFADCPITTRLAVRMAEVIKEQSSYPTGGALDWCRCQQYFNVTITAEVTPGGGMAHVMSGPLKMDFIMVMQGGKLLVDDTQCTGGGPSTSIYAPQLVVCG
jgi:hypothetical protein